MGEDGSEPDLFALRSAADELPVDDVFRLLASPTARATIIYCRDHPTPTLEELADAVTGAAASADETIATPADRDQVRIRLYHVTLPWLEELGFLTFDSGTNAVTETSIPDPVIDCLGNEA